MIRRFSPTGGRGGGGMEDDADDDTDAVGDMDVGWGNDVEGDTDAG